MSALHQTPLSLTLGTVAAIVMAGAGAPSTPLPFQTKGVDADLRRHDEAARPESRCQRRLVLPPGFLPRLFAVAAAVILLALATARAEEPATYVGTAACTGCHAAEAALWKTSHHAMAMQPATPATVLGGVTQDDRKPGDGRGST